MTYFYEPRRDYRVPGEIKLESRWPDSGDDPEYWGVYYYDEDGFLNWVIDFYDEGDARAFCEHLNAH